MFTTAKEIAAAAGKSLLNPLEVQCSASMASTLPQNRAPAKSPGIFSRPYRHPSHVFVANPSLQRDGPFFLLYLSLIDSISRPAIIGSLVERSQPHQQGIPLPE